MVEVVDAIIRGASFVLLLCTMGFTGSLIQTQAQVNPQVNFALFASVFGLLIGVFYGLIADFVHFLAWPIVVAFVDFLNFIFTFAAAIAVAAKLHAHSCSNRDFVAHNGITQGSENRCRLAQATSVFLFFVTVLFISNMVMSVLKVIKNGAFSTSSGVSRSVAVGV